MQAYRYIDLYIIILYINIYIYIYKRVSVHKLFTSRVLTFIGQCDIIPIYHEWLCVFVLCKPNKERLCWCWKTASYLLSSTMENRNCLMMLKCMGIKGILMCSGSRKIIEDASSLSHRLNISELHSSITMINLMKGLFTMLSPYERET